MADAPESLMERAVRVYAGHHVLQRLREGGEGALALGQVAVAATMLCQDVRGYADRGRGLSPATVAQLSGDYLRTLTGVVMRNGGLLDHYSGCAFLAYWLATDADHAQKACQAAVGCVQAARETAGRWRDVVQDITPMIALHTGTVMLGNVGAPARMQYALTGAAVNLTWRLMFANKDCGTEVLISETTEAALACRLPTEMVRRLDIAGGGSVTAYSLNGG